MALPLQPLTTWLQYQVSRWSEPTRSEPPAGRAIADAQFAQRDFAQARFALAVCAHAHEHWIEGFGVAVRQIGAQAYLETLRTPGDRRLGQLQGIGSQLGRLAADHGDNASMLSVFITYSHKFGKNTLLE